MVATNTLAIRKSYTGTGLGAYPDDPYYDPNRPSWFPYWIDTYTESLAKYNATTPVQAVINAGVTMGTDVGQAVGGTVGGAVSGAVTAISKDAITVITLIVVFAGFIMIKEITN